MDFSYLLSLKYTTNERSEKHFTYLLQRASTLLHRT